MLKSPHVGDFSRCFLYSVKSIQTQTYTRWPFHMLQAIYSLALSPHQIQEHIFLTVIFLSKSLIIEQKAADLVYAQLKVWQPISDSLIYCSRKILNYYQCYLKCYLNTAQPMKNRYYIHIPLALKENRKAARHTSHFQSSPFNFYNPATNEELSAWDVRIHASKFGADRENTLRADQSQDHCVPLNSCE